MRKFSKDMKINTLVLKKIKSGWGYRKGKKHNILIAPSRHKIPIPSTPSDCRAHLNFFRDVKQLEAMQGNCEL